MQLNEIRFDRALPVDGYGPGFFRIGGRVFSGPVLVTATHAQDWGGLDDTDALVGLVAEADVLLVGTGAQIAHLPPAFRATLEAAGLGVEMMSSPAACRTYNVLLSEGRRVAAALIPVD
jgi:uncharacterized protein